MSELIHHKMIIQFNVENQHMERIDNNLLVADSIDYLVAQFTFTEDWDGLIKTATFKKNGKAYYAILENDECIVPHEAIKPGTTYVSVHAGNLITSEVLELKFKVSGYQEPAEPTPSIYQQIMDKLNNLVGGHKDQVLTKNSEDDFDFKWRTGGGGGGGESIYWGDLGGYISDQEDLQEELNKKLSIKDMPTYDNLSYEKDYLYKSIYETLDYRYANEYMKSKKPIPLGACSSVRNGNFYGRNFDWTYDYNSEFIVNTPRTLDRYAVLGVASTVKLTDNFVKSGEASELYKIMPFMLMDGINEKGLVANVNVVPQDKGVTFGTTPRIELKDEICSSILVRFVLDHFATAAEAVIYLRDYCSIFTPSGLVEMGYEPHFMIADENETYIVEFVNNVISILNVTDKPIMTNFHLTGVTFNSLGEVIINRDNSGHNSSNISLNGSGLERFNLIVQNYDSIDNKQGMRDLMTQLNYTNTYNPSYPNFWYTEFTGIEGLNVTSPTYQFTSIVQREATKFANRSRDPLDTEHYGTWQTTHSSIYDISNRRLYLISQEDNIEKIYDLMSSNYSKDDVDEIIEDTKQWVEDKGYATEDSVPSSLSDLQDDSNHRTVSDEEKESWNAKSDFSGDYPDLTNKPVIPSIEGLASEEWVEDQGYAKESDVPQKISDLENDSDFVTRSVNTLVYYYLKTDVYTKNEVNDLISDIAQIHFQIVNVLPTRDIDLHTIYFVPKEDSTTNSYNEYIYINNKWELIGSTDVDLTNYFTKTEVNALLALKVGEVDIDPKLNSGVKIAEITVDGVTKSLYAPNGGSGTSDYDELSNRPKINNVVLTGNKSISDLGIDTAISDEVEDYVETHKSELKGDTGDSGVYIGSSEPTDPNVNVWINPSGNPVELLESSDLVANPTLSGDETSLSSIGIKGTNYKFEGSSGGGSWGSITGNISNQTDLQSALNDKANENAIDGMVDDRFVTAFQLNSVAQRQAIIDILLALGFTREELPDPVVPQSGVWQYKTTPTKGYIILGKDDDTHDEAMFVRMASGYGFPVTLNSIYGNAYDVSSHRQTDDADSEYSQYPVGSVSRLPEGGTIHDINMIVISNDLGEIALHGYNAIWDSDNVTDETWNTIYSNYTTGGGTKTKAEMIQALKDDYAGWDLSQGATEFVQARADLKSDLHTVIQTIGTWGVTHNFYVDDIAVASPSDLNISAWNVAREFNYWGAGIVTTNGNDVQDPWEYPRRSGGLASVQNLADACQYAYDHYGVVEVFTHQFFNGHGTQEQWTLFKSLMDELKDWVDDGKIEVVTRYEYSQLGEIVQNPITSLQFAPTSQSFSVGSQITESDFTCNAVFQDLTTSTCANDRVIDLSQINTMVAGTYTATLLYRGFKQTCTVTVSDEPTPTYILSNKTYSDSQMTRSTNICPETVSVESGKTYRFEFDFLAETEVAYSSHYVKFSSSFQNGLSPRYWGEMNVQIDTTQGTTTAHITVDCVSGATRTLDNLFACDTIQNTGIGAWTISNLYMWEVTT